MSVSEYILIAFPAILFILNPFMAASSFMMMTMDQSEEAQLRVAKRACLTSFLVLIVFAAAGQFIFQMFQITVEAFRIAGGIVLFHVGLSMLNFQPMRMKQTEQEQEEVMKNPEQDIGVVPLGIPILSGPGAITTVIVLMAEINWKGSKLTGFLQVIGLVISIVLSLVIIYIIFMNSKKLLALLKITGVGVMTRIMGLIITVIATQFVINGVRDLLPTFAKLL